MADLTTTTRDLIGKAVDAGLNKSEMCRELEITTRWLDDFINDKYQDYGVLRIQRLHDYLNKYLTAAA